jgi:hypothetical protein
MSEVRPNEAVPRRERLLPIVCAVWVLLAAFHAALLPVPLFPLDDAYIAAHNAAALLAGQDANFPGVSALRGSTSLVHLLLVAGLECVLSPAWALWASAWLSNLLLLVGVWRLGRLSELPWYLTALLVLIAQTAADASYQILNGIETGLSMAVIVWAFALRLDSSPRRPWLRPAVLGLLPLVRPELALLSGLLLVEGILGSPPERRVRRALHDIGFAGAVLAPGVLAYLVATGSPVPQTLSVKRDYFALPCPGPNFQLRWFGQGTKTFAGRLNLTALGLLLLCLPRVNWVGLAFVTGLLTACAVLFPEGVGHNEYRYLYPILPVCIAGFAHAWPRIRGRGRYAIVALAGCAALGAVSGLPRSIMFYLGDLNQTEQELEPVAAFIRENVAPSERILVHDIGYISTAVPNVLIDIVGLKDPGAATLHHTVTAVLCDPNARASVIARLAVERKARHLVVFAGWDQTFKLTTGLRNLGWSLTALRAPSVVYQVYLLAPPSSGP